MKPLELEISSLFHFFVGCISFHLHIHKMNIFTQSHIYFYHSLCVNAGLYPEYPDYSLTQKPSSMSGQKYLDEINSPDVVLFYFYAIPGPGRSLLLLPPRSRLMYNVNSTRRLMQSFTCKVLWKCHHQRSFEQTRALAYQVKPRYKI